MRPSRWVGGRQACKDAGWTDRLCTRLATPIYCSCLLIDPLWTAYTCTPPRGKPPSLTQLRRMWGGRVRAACSKQHLKWCLLSHRQSQRYWMTLASVVNIICCMQARSTLVSCDAVSLGTWWQHTLLSKATIACLKVAQGPKYSSGLNSVYQTIRQRVHVLT